MPRFLRPTAPRRLPASPFDDADISRKLSSMRFHASWPCWTTLPSSKKKKLEVTRDRARSWVTILKHAFVNVIFRTQIWSWITLLKSPYSLHFAPWVGHSWMRKFMNIHVHIHSLRMKVMNYGECVNVGLHEKTFSKSVKMWCFSVIFQVKLLLFAWNHK